MKRKVIVFANILAALLLYSNQLLFGQTSGLVQKKTNPTTYADTKLYEYYHSNSLGTLPRLLFPYNSSTFSSTDFLLDLKVDGTNNTKGLRLSSPLFSFEVLNVGTSYGLYQTGSNYVNYFGSKTAIGGTAAFQPVTTLHVAGSGILTNKLGIGLGSAPLTQLQIGSSDSVTLRFDVANGKNVVFDNNGVNSSFKFYGTTQMENPAKGGNIVTLKIPLAEIRHDGTILTQKIGCNVLNSGAIATGSLALTNGAQDGYIIVSNSRGDAYWRDPSVILPSLSIWKMNENETIYTTAPGVVIGNHPVTEKFQIGQQMTFHDGTSKKAISYNFNPTTGTNIATGAASSMEYQNDGDIVFKHSASGANMQEGLFLLSNGTVGIKTSDTFGYTLAVNGMIGCKEIKVEVSSSWPDYVFSPQYNLPALSEVERFVTTNGHLPDVPSAKEVASEGIAVGEMQATLLKKVEELTLYIIQQEKTIEKQQSQINELKTMIQSR